MLCATISGPSFSQAKKQILASLNYVDSIELRIDRLLSLSLAQIQQLMSLSKISVLTLKSHPNLTHSQWVEKTLELASLNPTYLDIDYLFPSEALRSIRLLYPQVKIILSYHSDHYESVSSIFTSMKKQLADRYKVVVTAKNTLDPLKVLQEKNQLPDNVTALCMGEEGIVSRICSPIIKNPINYVSGIGSSKGASGQLSIPDLLAYNYLNLSPSSSIYGLIGNPVDKSISHLSHNYLLSLMEVSASYIKMPLTHHELHDFFKIAKNLPIKGLSVTMPFKTEVLKYIDELDSSVTQCQSCNTLLFHNQNIKGYNTDGLGLIHAFKRKNISLNKANIAILGAGGAAKAIAQTCHALGAHITIFNRTIEKARSLASLCEGDYSTLDSLKKKTNIDILISCLPHNSPIPKIFPPIVMDINTLPLHSSYTKQAREEGSQILYGYEMFIEQALLQFAIWFPHLLSKENQNCFRKQVEKIMKQQSVYKNIF